MAMAMRRRRSASSRRRRSASARAAAIRSRLLIRRESLRDSFAEARSSRPLRPRSAFASRAVAFALFPRRASAARSRFDWRESLREDAVSRPPFLAGALAADLAAGFLADFAGFLAAACAEKAAAKRMRAETENAARRGKRNLGVIDPSSLKKLSRRDRVGREVFRGGARPDGSNR